MQHLQRGPETVHLCKITKTTSCHIETKLTKKYNKASLFVTTIISSDRLCSLCVISLIPNKHILAAAPS